MNAGSPATPGTHGSSSMRVAAVRRLLLASEGRLFTPEVIDESARLVVRGGRVRVLAIARIWGTALGLPHPGLKPNEREMAEHEDNIAQAIRRLKRFGLRADGHIIATRKPCKSILAEAAHESSEMIVMGCDPPRNVFMRDLMWSQEPYRVERKARVVTRLVSIAATTAR